MVQSFSWWCMRYSARVTQNRSVSCVIIITIASCKQHTVRQRHAPISCFACGHMYHVETVQVDESALGFSNGFGFSFYCKVLCSIGIIALITKVHRLGHLVICEDHASRHPEHCHCKQQRNINDGHKVSMHAAQVEDTIAPVVG